MGGLPRPATSGRFGHLDGGRSSGYGLGVRLASCSAWTASTRTTFDRTGSRSKRYRIGQSAQGTLFCPAGKEAVGGGWDNNAGGGFGTGMTVTRSAPTSDGSGWTGAIANASGGTVHITLYAICITANSAPSTLSRTTTENRQVFTFAKS